MNEEEKLKRITRLLEKGCTMLAAHHDCGAPLFRCRGKILCPICTSSSEKLDTTPIGETDADVSRDTDEIDGPVRNRAVAEGALTSSVEPMQALDREREHREDDRRRHSQTNPESERLAQNSGESSPDGEFEAVKQSMKMAVLFKLKDLASDIKEEKDLCRLRSQLDCVDAALSVISSLK
jgi:UPF0148 protein